MSRFPIGGGAFVGVVGPSGAGKDAVMRFARDELAGDPGFRFIRRCITRPRDDVGEDHDPVEPAAFGAMKAEGRFALDWEAHGKCYGIPVEADAMVEDGAVVVANLSRTVLSALGARYRRCQVVEITAAPDILAARIAARGRETLPEIELRLARDVAIAKPDGLRVIDNSGRLEEAGGVFLALLKELAAGT